MSESTNPADLEEAALDRYHLIQPYLDGRCSIAALARDTGISKRTLWSWCKGFKARGLSALQRKERSDQGMRRSLEVDIGKLIEALCLQRPAPSIASVHRQISKLCINQGWKCPSYATVARTSHAIDPAVRTMAQEGNKVYKQQYDLLFRREALASNDIWQCDHTPLDLYVTDAHGNIVRPWLTIVLDDYSRAIAGYYLAVDAPAAWKTALALRQAIYRKDDPRWNIFGVPESLYTDHGSDFTSKRMEVVAVGIKMRLINSQVGQPRGRGKIERFFRTVNELLLCEVPGFAPGGLKPKGNLITLEKFDELFRKWLIEDYMTRTHSETGIAPAAKWESDDFIPRLPESIEQLDLLLCMETQERKVHRDGVRFHGLRYMDVNLCGYIGELVTVRYDPRDIAEVLLYYRDQFICRAVCQEIADQVSFLKVVQIASVFLRRSFQVLGNSGPVSGLSVVQNAKLWQKF